MRWWLAVVLAFVSSLPAMSSPRLAGTLDSPDFWQNYQTAFISPGGRVMDNANGNISHSEGQGYGMLLAVAAGDPATFARVWAWTRSQLMLRDDGLAAWRWDPAATPHVRDRNNAADGDILIAWALAEAGDAWAQPGYRTAALEMIRAIADHDLGPSDLGPVLKPGSTGFAAGERPDGPVVNLSYWVFPALARFAELAPDRPFAAVIGTGLKLAAAAQFGPRHLPSDWISLARTSVAPAQGFAPTFGYDAIRVPLYLVWGGQTSQKALAPYDALFSNADAAPERIDVLSGQPLEPLVDSGYRAVAALTRCALHGSAMPAALRAPEVDRYYPSTLRALSWIAARETGLKCP